MDFTAEPSRACGGPIRAALLFAALAFAAATSARAAPEVRKYALSLFHFNVQYVAGGTIAFFPQAMNFDRTAEQTEDSIVVESFEPILDLLLAHPTWGMDLEMQAYMLDVIAERHPQILDKIRTLARRGQVDFPSFHYSDQLFLAYPTVDWERSALLAKKTFERHGVPMSTSVFCQEGQAGVGLAQAMKRHGFKTLIWPRNLFIYQHGDQKVHDPLYKFGDVRMLTSRGGQTVTDKVDLNLAWTFFDDGELLATGDVNPYFPEQFTKKPEAVAKYERDLIALEAAGFRITTVAKYAAEIEPLLVLAENPPLLDGTWQPKSTGGIHKWLGGMGIWMDDERDNDVRTLGAIAHRELMLAEAIADSAGLDAGAEIAQGFRLLALGQVTDASGINPYRGEIEYGLAHLAEVTRISREVIRRAKEKLGKENMAVFINSAKGTVEAASSLPVYTAAASPLGAMGDLVVSDGGRTHEVTWDKSGEGVYRATVTFGAGDGPARSIAVKFPGRMGDLVYTPGLLDAPVHVARAGFAFREFELALSDGLIGLGHGFVIKDQAFVHVSAKISTAGGDVDFTDDTAATGEPQRWVFYYVPAGEGADAQMKAEAQAAALARSINVLPEARR